jgi:hypothetical protein
LKELGEKKYTFNARRITKIYIFHLVVLLPKILNFLAKRSAIVNFSAILNFEEKNFLKNMDSKPNLTKKINLQVLNNENVLTSILKLSAILKINAWRLNNSIIENRT